MRPVTPPQHLWDLGNARTIKDRIVQAILERMSDGTLAVGTMLPPEAILCREMGVSRVALREAVKQLEVLGFVRISRGNGTVVTAPTLLCAEPAIEFLGKTKAISFANLHELRTLIEVEVVGLLAQSVPHEVMSRLSALVAQGILHIDDPYGYVTLDYEFHQSLLDASPNPLLPMVLAPFSAYLKKSRELSFASVAKARKAFEAHAGIARAIHEGRREQARERMRRHLAETARDLRLPR